MTYSIFILAGSLLLSTVLTAQQPAAKGSLPGGASVGSMTPAELEAYKQKVIAQATQNASAAAQKSGIALPDMQQLRPGDIQPPVKDIKRLQLLPSQPPTRTELVQSLRQSVQQVQQGIPGPKIQEIEDMTRSLPVEVIQDKAILRFYGDDPRTAVAMMMQAAIKAPDSLQVLNNLGAMLNIQDAADKAIPLLQYCLQKVPGSSTVLNNIGQSFMALGDLLKAAAYFNQCLAVDSLNPEANHSMGMLSYFKKDYNNAMHYFEREMVIAIRSSTIAMAYRMGRKFNLRELQRRRNRLGNRPEKNHFEEITMGKFSFPILPSSARGIEDSRALFAEYGASIQAEQLAWMGYATSVAAGYNPEMGNQHHGLYTELVEAMLEELQEEFTPEYLSALSQDDYDHIQSILTLNYNLLAGQTCPPAPEGTRVDAMEAYEIKCCRELKQPVVDRMVYQVSSFVQPLIRKAEGRWKSYINQLVEIVQLDPSPSNQAVVYNAVAGYFNFLSVSMTSFALWHVNTMLPKCFSTPTSEAVDSLIESDRNWRVNCPPWLNAKIDFDGMSVSVDCSKYSIEAGSSLAAGYEYEFATGNATLLLGPATKTEFMGIKATMKEQAFITFDRNKRFADFGIKATAEVGVSSMPIKLGPGIKLGGTIAAASITNSWSLNSGFKTTRSGKGLFK